VNRIPGHQFSFSYPTVVAAAVVVGAVVVVAAVVVVPVPKRLHWHFVTHGQKKNLWPML
jgi:membrane protein YdbS with pleckstrin-like domain